MTILEFWGGALITFGPGLAMFSLTIAQDPIRIIIFVAASFFWLMSFLVAAMLWPLLNMTSYGIHAGAIIAVILQEGFRYLFLISTKKVEVYFNRMLKKNVMNTSNESRDLINGPSSSTSANVIQTNNNNNNDSTIDNINNIHKEIPIGYVAGLGFGLMNGAFSMMNVLTDYIGPGTVGIKGNSTYFLLSSSLTASAFILLNVAWSIMISEGIAKSDDKFLSLASKIHILLTSITFLNGVDLQIVSLIVIYGFTILSGLAAFRISGLDVKLMFTNCYKIPRSV